MSDPADSESKGPPVAPRLVALALPMVGFGAWVFLRDDPFASAPLRGVGLVLLGLSVLAMRARLRRAELLFAVAVVCVVAGYAWRYGEFLLRVIA